MIRTKLVVISMIDGTNAITVSSSMMLSVTDNPDCADSSVDDCEGPPWILPPAALAALIADPASLSIWSGLNASLEDSGEAGPSCAIAPELSNPISNTHRMEDLRGGG